MIHATAADIARFRRYVEILPCGCHFWTGARSRGRGNRKWYGSFWIKGRVVRAHRFAAEVLGGLPPLPPGHDRDHTCCFSLCVNPDHLEHVTKAENQKRKHARRRALAKDPVMPRGPVMDDRELVRSMTRGGPW